MIDERTKKAMHVLRNPFGWDTEERRRAAHDACNAIDRLEAAHESNSAWPYPPPPPPPREFKSGLFGGETETRKSIQNRRDYEMFMKGFRFAHGEPNIPQPGDYV